MEFKQLEMFVAVVEERSVRKAAVRVFRTAPAVSMSLRKLEEEAGVALFDRSAREGRRPTDAGEALFHHAKRLLAERDRALDSLARLRSSGRRLRAVG